MNPILLIILAIILPPVAVALKDGAGKHLVISIILTLLFFLPGVIHAIWLVLQKPEAAPSTPPPAA